MSPHPLILIHGFPGTGKSTIAQALITHPSISEYMRLIGPHFVLSPDDAILHRDCQDLQRSLRKAIFKFLMTERATYHTTYIFTGFQLQTERKASSFAEYEQVAENRDCGLIPILLTCDEGENIKRMMTDRNIMYVELLRTYRNRNGVLLFNFKDNKESLKIDVTFWKPEEVAELIWDHV
ncbi:hypothetical protein N7451_011285 [Penicillium sp. IBT 35674x]|nr:hypothetical protein N7451_011285 [Penicillium sp. IBT 35674x]